MTANSANGWTSTEFAVVRSLGLFDAWPTLRGIKTLDVRMRLLL